MKNQVKKMIITELEDEAKEYYDKLWSNPNRIQKIIEEIPSWHFGFYEKGIKNSYEAIINMMDYVGRLLDLNNESYMNILDTGSGVGTTSLYLAKRFSNCIFHGITISSYESLIAGIWTTAANAGFILWWLTIGTTLIITARSFGLLPFVVFAVVHWLCDFLWYTGISFAIFKSKQFWTARVHQAIFFFCFAVLIGFGVWFFSSALWSALITLS